MGGGVTGGGVTGGGVTGRWALLAIESRAGRDRDRDLDRERKRFTDRSREQKCARERVIADSERVREIVDSECVSTCIGEYPLRQVAL